MLDDPESLLKLIEQHLSWYPLMELRDVYKLLYQGVMGSEHLLTSQDEFTRYLSDEFEQIQPDPTQHLLEPIRPDEILLRINLRPYKSRQLKTDLLAQFLIKTAQMITGTQAELRTTWAIFVQLCHDSQVNIFDKTAVDLFSRRLDELNYPAMHHSEPYNREYQPSYRLLSATFIHPLGLTDAG